MLSNLKGSFSFQISYLYIQLVSSQQDPGDPTSGIFSNLSNSIHRCPCLQLKVSIPLSYNHLFLFFSSLLRAYCSHVVLSSESSTWIIDLRLWALKQYTIYPICWIWILWFQIPIPCPMSSSCLSSQVCSCLVRFISASDRVCFSFSIVVVVVTNILKCYLSTII